MSPCRHGRDRLRRIARAACLAGMLSAGTAGVASDRAAAPGTEGRAAHGQLLPRDSRDAAVFRGGLVYANYCVTCHGINADGNGRAARLYDPKPTNLRASDKNDDYLALMIRSGGERLARSPFMPPWGAELTDEQIRDLVVFLRSINVTEGLPAASKGQGGQGATVASGASGG